MSTPFRTTIKDGVAELVLDHPPVNAFDSAGWFAIARELDALGADNEVRVIVIGGEGNGGVILPALHPGRDAVLGVALLNVQEKHGFLQSAVYGFGAAVGFSMVMILFAAMRERIAVADVPEAFKGSAIALITAGLMSMAFMGFAGLVKG